MQHTEPFPGDQSSLPPPVTIPTGLLGGVLRGDPDAWQRLVYLYVPLVLYWCRQRGLEDTPAEEAACEVFHVVAARLGEWTAGTSDGSFRTWLRRLVHDYLNDLRPVPGVESAGEEVVERCLLYRRTLDLLYAEFEPGQWVAAQRTILQEQTPETVAAEFGLPLAAVFAAKALVLGRLREELRDLEE